MKNYFEYRGKIVTLMLCSSCNINCEHCYISFGGNRTVKELTSLIPLLLEKGYRVDLNGAEVLTNPAYLQFYKMTHNTELMTNGLAIYQNPDLLKLIKENGITTIAISYHFELHNVISKVPKEIILKVIHLCLESGLKVLINTTISNTNFTNIERMCEEAISIGATAIRFTNFLKQGNVLKNSIEEYALSRDEVNLFFEQLNRMRKKYNPETLYIHRSGLFDVDLCNRNSHFVCTAGWDDVTITPDNMVYPCIFLAKKGFEIGKFEDGIIKIQQCFHNNGQHCCASQILNRGENIFYES